MNVFELLADAVRRRGDAVAVEYGPRALSYAEFAAAAAGFSRWLRDRGCQPGGRVLLFAGNCLEYPVFMLGAFHAGMVAVPVNAKLHVREAAYIAGDCAPSVIVCRKAVVEELREAMQSPKDVVFLAVEDFDAHEAALSPSTPSAEVDPDAVAWLFYTSGTTGRPKGAMLTHRNLIAASVNCLADVYPFTERDTALHLAPLSHGSGLYLLPSFARGVRNIISDLPNFQPDRVLEIVAREKISVIAFMAPTMIVRLLDAAPRDDVGHLKGVIYGGAPIHLEHVRAAVARFGPIFTQLYGQGEAPMTISYLPAIDHFLADDDLLLSAGYVRSGVEVRIVDEADRDVAAGQEGEIVVRGDVVMKGYWDNAEGTASTLRGGWLHTGDLGRFDGAGRLRVLDRRHDTIISGGSNIYPKEIEDIVATHPGVREVIAFGVPDREWGESVAVAIVADESANLSAAIIADFCRDHLASFKKPRYVHFVAELPKNAYGKVLRRELRETLASPPVDAV